MTLIANVKLTPPLEDARSAERRFIDLIRRAGSLRFLYLRRPAINEELGSCDETRIVGCDKECCRSDLMRLPDPAHRDDRYELVLDLSRNAFEDPGVDRAGTDYIHTNVPVL